MDLRSELRRLQLLVLVCACLSRNGKCREILELALGLDEQRVLSRLTPPPSPAVENGLHQWLEAIWGREDLSNEELEVVWWQNALENLQPALGELVAIERHLGGVWPLWLDQSWGPEAQGQ